MEVKFKKKIELSSENVDWLNVKVFRKTSSSEKQINKK